MNQYFFSQFVTDGSRKELPDGSDFRDIINDNMIFVDKTDVIYKMITELKNVFISRPPRFGKSLLLSTLSYLFEGGYSNSVLFNETKIKKTFEYPFPKYNVLRFDFSRLSSTSLRDFNSTLRLAVGDFLRKYGIIEQGCTDEMYLKRCTVELLHELKEKTSTESVVLIDEYDEPWRNFKGNQEDRQGMLDIMQDFFKALKSEDMDIRFCFVTGSTKIALSEFYSGYNCATDISWLPDYETIVGFSEHDLRTYFNEYVEAAAKKRNETSDQIYQLLNEKFEGFRFSIINANMYNSQEVIDFLRTPMSMEIGTYSTRISSRYVIETIRKMPILSVALELMNELDQKSMIPVGIDFIRGFKDRFDHPLAALKDLYEGGILSIKDFKYHKGEKPNEYFIGFSNRVAKDFYHKLLEEAFKDFIEFTKTSFDPGFRVPLKDRDILSFIQRVDSHFMEMPYVIIPKTEDMVEAVFQVSLFYGLRLSGLDPSWETMLAYGRLDVRFTDDDTICTCELKRKSNPDHKNTMVQCDKYSRNVLYRGKKLVCIGIVFNDKPSETGQAVAEYGIIERFPNGSLVPGRDSFDLIEFQYPSNALEKKEQVAGPLLGEAGRYCCFGSRAC